MAGESEIVGFAGISPKRNQEPEAGIEHKVLAFGSIRKYIIFQSDTRHRRLGWASEITVIQAPEFSCSSIAAGLKPRWGATQSRAPGPGFFT